MFKLGRIFALDQLKSVFYRTDHVAVKGRKFYCTPKFQVKKPILLPVQNNQIWLGFRDVKLFHKSAEIKAPMQRDDFDDTDEKKSLIYYPEFEKWEEKNKKTFLETVRVYKQHAKNRSSHVDFIKAALKNMKAHGVHNDLETYKKILDVLPKGVYVIKNVWMARSFYFPRQQLVVMDLLTQMGNNGVSPDAEMGFMLLNIFGKNSNAYKMFQEMLYWTLKWKNKSPFILPKQLPSDPFLLAKIGIERITSVDPQTEISTYETSAVKDSIDKTWIVSGQSPKQKKLLKKHSNQVPVIVEGSNLLWLGDKSISYFVLKADGNPLPFVYPEDTDDILNLKSKFFNPNYVIKKKEDPTVHEQDDGIIYGVCATGSSSKDSLLSWIRILETNGNAVLSDIPVLFRFTEKEKLPHTFSEALVQQETK